MDTPSVVIVSLSSDIGLSMANHWHQLGWRVAGTYRTPSPAVEAAREIGIEMAKCDCNEPESIDRAIAHLAKHIGTWNVLVIAHGTMEPIGPFEDTDFNAWAASHQVNFTSQLRFLHGLLPSRHRGEAPTVLFFAGGGTNGPTRNSSAYTIAKIGLIKMCELLDAEMPDVRFAAIGPGWVRTKIHKETLRAGERAGDSLRQTEERLASGDFTSISDVIACCEWIIAQDRESISGRNFSVAHDAWGDPKLVEHLKLDPHMFKLRRAGNTKIRRQPAHSSEKPND